MKKKYVLKDIAERSGVSIGTVDRVIHNRGRVSKESIEKVNRALKELDYTPNPMARSLRNNTVYKILILIPDPKKDPYWIPCERGIDEIVSEFRAFDVEIDVKKYNPSSPRSFSTTGNRTIGNNPDALLFVPLFDKESEQLTEKLDEKGILTATFNSPVRMKVGQHVGQDLFLSGRVAAKLVQGVIAPSSDIAIIHIDEAINNALHMREKENGFKRFFEENKIKRHIPTLTAKTNELEEGLGSLIKKHPKLDAFFVTTSKAYKVAQVMGKLEVRAKIIGYDLLPQNVAHLQNGNIEYLIHQTPKLQASLSLRSIIEKLLFSKESFTEKLLPIEIINSENVKSYL